MPDTKKQASLADERIEAYAATPLHNELSAERVAEEKRLKRLLDCRLLPTIIAIFVLNYIDRNALAAARLKGLERDLNLSTVQYESALAILYAAYSPFQIPSNMILNKIKRPSVYIGGCTIVWGLTSTLTGTVTNFSGLMASVLACLGKRAIHPLTLTSLRARFFIGLPESAFYCGSMFLLSRWYTKKEMGVRAALLFVGLLLSNAFGCFVAAGILSNMEGTFGHPAWRWLFWIEGSTTMLVGLVALWSLPDYPDNTRWITPEQRLLAQKRLAEDMGEADKDSSGETFVHGLKMAIVDRKCQLFILGTLAQHLGFSFTNFFPSLTKTLGYGTTETLLLSAPPWVLAAIVCVINAWHADRVGERYWHITWTWWGVMIGYVIGITTKSIASRYVSLFLLANGFCGSALTLVYVANSIPRPPAKRAAAMGLVNGIGNLGSLMGSFVWKVEWAPGYHQSMILGMCSISLALACFTAVRQILVHENKKLDREQFGGATGVNYERIQEFARLEGITLEEAFERKRGFRYIT